MEIAKEMAPDNYKLIQFHPAYTYEDFVRGIVATTGSNGNINYDVKNKVLAEMAENAKNNPDNSFVLIIDEINRANLSSVLGELIYALEYRGEVVESMYEYEESREIVLPENLYIIGTMNTADRSVGHIDYAIRRRFAFVDVNTDESVIPNK
jgi:5-methylcytosine-specific restriction protein B